MAVVKFEVSSAELQREEKAARFHASNDGGAIGELRVSKGGIRWYPRGPSKARFVRWENLTAERGLQSRG